MHTQTKRILLTTLLVIASATGGFFAGKYTSTSTESVNAAPESTDVLTETRGGGYRYINPLLECDNFSPSRINAAKTMEKNIRSYMQLAQNDKRAVHVSVYFRDLNNGPWMGVNERENYSPASLLKVPILIATFKKGETEPGFLNKKIHYREQVDKNVVPNIVDQDLIKVGNTYTIDNLVYRMIVHSDNEAKELLIREIGEQLLTKVMSDIGINLTGVTATSDFISVRDYSGFFRLLYNATYLNREMSEKALELMTKTSYSKGIVAGLPKGMVVSHKFGERAFTDSNLKQLHDCGIVYNANSPYLLCIMTRGYHFDELASIIAEISGIVHKEVSQSAQ